VLAEYVHFIEGAIIMNETQHFSLRIEVETRPDYNLEAGIFVQRFSLFIYLDNVIERSFVGTQQIEV